MAESNVDGITVLDALSDLNPQATQVQPIRSKRVPVHKTNGIQQVVVSKGYEQRATSQNSSSSASKRSSPPPRSNGDSQKQWSRGGHSKQGRGGHHNGYGSYNGHKNGGSYYAKSANHSGIPQTQRPSRFSVSDRQGVAVRRPAETWRSLPEISIKVSNLPPETTTLDLYIIFERYGSIEWLEITENGKGVRDGTARIKFCPPPREAFWENSPKRITKTHDNGVFYINMAYEEPRRSYVVESPVTKKKLPEKFEFSCKKIDFGFMIQESTMMSMFSTLPESEVSFEVNLKKRLVIVKFTHEFTDPPGYQLPKGVTTLARTDSFRFEIPFVSLDIIYEDPESTPDDRILIISLPSPPSFWKKVHDITRTHDDDSKWWSERHSWFRQTDIIYNHGELREQAVAIKKKRPLIDLGRWTTYRITFNLDDKQRREFISMISAIKDFNVKSERFEDFSVQSDHAARIWDIIDPPVASSGDVSFANELAELESVSVHTTLPFPLRYQLEVCISEGCLSEYNLTKEFVDRLLQLEESRRGSAVRLLEVVADTDTRFYDPMAIFNLKVSRDPKIGIPSYCSIMRKATITPTMVYFSTPSVETSNRVVRNYLEHGDRFLRVQFTDERGRGRVSANDYNMMNEVYTRAKRALTNGITIGDRHFEFLAFGNSQLREHGAYFFSSTEHLTAADIRNWMGVFSHIRQVAKHAARLGQCFSTTFSVNTVRVTINEIDDIEHDGYCFSDGCGMISEFVSQMIASELRFMKDGVAPSAYQFRLGGCKGVLAVSPKAQNREVFIRPSQRKFNTTHNGLEIIRSSHLAAAYLNRQLIAVFKTLGVNDNIFMRKLQNQLSNLHEAMQDQSIALGLLRKHIDPNQATLHVAGLILSGFFKSKEPFTLNLLQLWRAWTIKALKEKARIVVEDGAFVIGVVDESGKLKGHYDLTPEQEEKWTSHERLDNLPEIFLQITDPNDQSGYRIIEGVCLLARNPSLHPGDIRVVRAVKCDDLKHLRNVVVLPQTGTRSLSSMCSGGDLDGDDYIVIWDNEFVPTIINHPPMDYSAPKPNVLDRDVSTADITSFFVNYMKMDKLGTIAHAHLAWSDFYQDGVKSDKCLRLAELHSMAVDFNKTGDPAKMEKDLRVHRWPHFMEKHPDNPDKTRISNKILGKLYDAVEKIAFVPRYEHSFDGRILNAYNFDGNTIQLAKIIKKEYDWAMRRIMGQHAIQTEFEVYSTFVMSHSGLGSDYKYHEEIGQIRDGLKDRFKKVIKNALGSRSEKTIGCFAVAMYQVTSDEYALYKDKPAPEQRVSSVPLISFPWLFDEYLVKVVDGIAPFEDCNRLNKDFPEDDSTTKEMKETPLISLATEETIAAFFAEKHSQSLELEVDSQSVGKNDASDTELDLTKASSKAYILETLNPDGAKNVKEEGNDEEGVGEPPASEEGPKIKKEIDSDGL